MKIINELMKGEQILIGFMHFFPEQGDRILKTSARLDMIKKTRKVIDSLHTMHTRRNDKANEFFR